MAKKWASLSPLVILTLSFLYSFGGAAQNQKNGGGSNGVGVAQQATAAIPPTEPEYALTTNGDACPNGDSWCSDLEETDKLALEAIRSLHHQLDDDQNGNIDLAESDEFLREELKYEKNVENRQKGFHRNDDTQVSVRELWETWSKSEVHNWTVEQTVEWLIFFVGLPQQQGRFTTQSINGTVLPILAVNHNNYMQNNLGIKDVITRQRLAVKAMDVVLFGPPRDNSNRVKDAILTTLLAVAVIACYLVYKRYQWAQEDLSKMSKHMAELSKAEETLMDLQKELEKARTVEKKEADVVAESKILGDDPEEVSKLREENMTNDEPENLEQVATNSLVVAEGNSKNRTPSCCEELEDEIFILRSELHRAEVELQDKCWVPPPALQHWMQYTYELELKTYNKKKTGAEKQLKQAKDACDKLKKKRSSLMGAFVTTHGRSIDDVDKAILEARTALTEITYELQERMHRWKQIEFLIGCSVMNNPGIQYLENLLKVYGKPQSYASGPGSVISNSQDDIDDDAASSIYCPSAVSGPTSHSQTQLQQLAMSRSKSASSMLSLRDRAMLSRDSSSKDSSNGEDDVGVDPSDINNSRRVTFRADHRSRMKAFSNGRANGSLFDSMDNEEARRVVNRALSQTQSLESIASTKDSKPEEKTKEVVTSKSDEMKSQSPIPNGHHNPQPLTDCGTPSAISEENNKTTPRNGDAQHSFNSSKTSTTPIVGFVSSSTLYTSPKGKKKLWTTLTKIVNTTKGNDNKHSYLGKEKDKSMSKESVANGTLKGLKNGLLTSSSTTNKKNGKRISGILSSLRRSSDKSSADVTKLPVEA